MSTSSSSDLTMASTTPSLHEKPGAIQQVQQAPAGPAPRWQPGMFTGLLGRIKYFAPAWFAVTMGTGITSILLHNLPYQFKGLNTIAIIFFVLNVVLFCTFTAMSIARYIMHPAFFMKMLCHPASSLFLGTFAMGFATVGDGVVLFCVPALESRDAWIRFAWALWWLDALVSVLIAIGVPYVMFVRQTHTPTSMTAVWFLPVVAPIVAAAHGGIVADVLKPTHALVTIAISYMMLGIGLAPAFLLMALYFQRLAFHKLPPTPVIFSTFLPVGPCGQSAYAFLQLSRMLVNITERDPGLGQTLFSSTDVRTLVLGVYACSMVVALFMLGLGVFWMTLAIASVVKTYAKTSWIPFNLGFWALTFPIGTMASAAIMLARELDSHAFRGLAMFLSMWVVVAWLLVAPATLYTAWTGAAFAAPELAPPPAPAPVAGDQKV
ncbi:Plasma membrane sulfite pump involved in sulfite metabolism [Microbotryomycetes sp. JL201]|nr:Plasma membrane sulfite pump involved in sulfite metabolism [Microbotryomycetes sp. JL201]